MKTTFAVILCVLLLLFSACAQKINDPADVQAIQAMCVKFGEQTTARNLPAYLSTYYTSDAVRLPPNGSPIVGIEAIRKLVQADLDQYTAIKETDVVVSVTASGDMAHARGTWTWTATPKASGLSVVNDNGKWMGAYQRQSDGTWKCIYDIWNSDQPAAGTTADGAEEKALIQMERDWVDALLKSDATAFDHHIAKEWTYNSDGQVSSKAQVLAEIKSGAYKLTSVELSDLSPHVFGDVAVVTGTMVMKGKYKGSDIPSPQRSTDFFVKRDGQWQAVNSQNVTVK